MKVKVSEATDLQLNWMVSLASGVPVTLNRGVLFWTGTNHIADPISNWSQGGPIFSEAGIGAAKSESDEDWIAMRRYTFQRDDAYWCGPTELIAKARCFVVSKLGEEVEVPEELT